MLVESMKGYFAEAVPATQKNYSQLKQFKYHTLPEGTAVLHDGVDVDQIDRIVSYGESMSALMEANARKLRGVREEVHEDYAKIEALVGPTKEFTEKERDYVDRIQTLAVQEKRL